MRVLVTGACGFVGRFLVKRLCASGQQLITAVQNRECEFGASVESIVFDLTNQDAVLQAIHNSQPEVVLHLAAQSDVAKSWANPGATLEVNTLGTLHLLEAIRVLPQIRLINIGSSDEYGLTAQQGLPLTEEAPCRPQNPYAVSKFAAGQLVLQFARRYQLQVLHLRPFNHFGPGQRTGFVVSDFCSQIVQLEQQEVVSEIPVGDLTAQRDFTDVRDVVEAYAMIVEQGLPTGIYNICSGQPRSVAEILTILMGLAKRPLRFRVSPNLLRPIEVPFFVGSANKLTQAIGWHPQRGFYASLAETLEWWRAQ